MKKVYAILTIYDLIISGQHFKIEDLERLLKCSRRTCVRYLNDIRGYFKDSNIQKELIFDKKIKSFKLVEALD